MHEDHDILRQLDRLDKAAALPSNHLSPNHNFTMLFNMLARYFMLSVLAERVVCAVLPHQEILTSRPAEKDPNAIIAA